MVITQKFRASLEPTKVHDSEHAKTNKKVNFLKQVLLIANWISNMDITKINDVFDNSYNVVPTEL